MTTPLKLGFFILLGSLLAVVCGAITASADSREEAMDLRQTGDILPLETFTKKIHALGYQRILEVELETEAGSPVYEIEALGEGGNVREFYFDAASGEPVDEAREQED